MDAHRFDALSRSLAAPASRRKAVRALGAGGLLTTLLGRSAAAATDSTATCELTISGLLSSGPDANGPLDGTIEIAIGKDGAIDDGSFTTDNKSMDVVGKADGRALDLLIDLGDGTSLALLGVGQNDISLCRGDLAGIVTGPQPGDVGSWTATSKKKPAATSTSGTTGATTSGGNTSSGSSSGGTTGGNSSGDNSGGGDTRACSTVMCNGVCCQPRAGFTPDSIDCEGAECSCTYSCQSAGCPNGGTEHSFTIGCDSRPDAVCGENCNFPTDNGCGDMTCDDGQTLDVDSCTCVSDGGGGVACATGLTNCGDTDQSNCVDTSSDPANCGGCGNACPDGNDCEGGTCVDPCADEGLFICNGECVDLLTDDDNCGDCNFVCDAGAVCVNAFCI